MYLGTIQVVLLLNGCVNFHSIETIPGRRFDNCNRSFRYNNLFVLCQAQVHYCNFNPDNNFIIDRETDLFNIIIRP